MSALPDPVTRLVNALRKLPGVGPRSAERMALQLVQAPRGEAEELALAIQEARDRVIPCSTCGSLTEADPCPLCTDDHREGTMICVVEQPVDIVSLERSGTFKGRYHVLGGKISPLDGIGPEDLRIDALDRRLVDGTVQEVILALGTDVEGDATSHYLSKHLGRAGLKVTRIAHGLPAGAGLELADQLTLARALEGRREL
jgi:recombination protein RecR